MKEYKAPETRIKVVKSEVRTDYIPQYKTWFGLWIDYGDYNRHYMKITINTHFYPGTLDFAKAVIDKHNAYNKGKYSNKKHEIEHRTTYIKYP